MYVPLHPCENAVTVGGGLRVLESKLACALEQRWLDARDKEERMNFAARYRDVLSSRGIPALHPSEARFARGELQRRLNAHPQRDFDDPAGWGILQDVSQMYEQMFCRHQGANPAGGLISSKEQEIIRNSKILVPGCGAVGGWNIILATRLGIGGIVMADKDTYGLPNISRQPGARQSTLGRNKAEVMAEDALDINPLLDTHVVRDFVTEDNAPELLKGVDVVTDGIDFWATHYRLALARTTQENGKWFLTAGPIGEGAVAIAFGPGSMGVDAYYGLKPGMSTREQTLRFLAGMPPGLRTLNRGYFDMEAVDPAEHLAPAVGYATSFSASYETAMLEQVLLEKMRGGLPRGFPAAHSCVHVDLRTHRSRRFRMHPWMREYIKMPALRRMTRHLEWGE